MFPFYLTTLSLPEVFIMTDADVKTSDIRGLGPDAKEIDEDIILVKAYLNGDIYAFEKLYKKYQSIVFNVVNRMVGSEDAHDLTQEVFLSVIKSLSKFRYESKFSTWLYSIAKNTCLNRIRCRKRLKEDSLDMLIIDQPGFEIADDSVNIENTIEANELKMLVNNVLNEMKPEYKMLIVLRDFQQLSYEEISNIMNINLQTVKSRLHRARLSFKEKFKPFVSIYKVK